MPTARRVSARACPAGRPVRFVDQLWAARDGNQRTCARGTENKKDSYRLTARKSVFRRNRWYLDNLMLACLLMNRSGETCVPLSITSNVDMLAAAGGLCVFFPPSSVKMIRPYGLYPPPVNGVKGTVILTVMQIQRIWQRVDTWML